MTIQIVLVVCEKAVNSVIPGIQQGHGCMILSCNPNSEQVTLSNCMCNSMRFQMFIC